MSIACLVATIFLLCWAMATRPAGAQCPPRWYVNGVRATGEYECRPVPAGDPDADGTWQHPDVTSFNDLVISGQIYCRPGTVPLVFDERTVGCRAGLRR